MADRKAGSFSNSFIDGFSREEKKFIRDAVTKRGNANGSAARILKIARPDIWDKLTQGRQGGK